MKEMIIKTKDFLLRPLKMSDAKGYWEVIQDKETKKCFTSVPKSFIGAKKEIREMLEEVKEKGSEIFTIIIGKKYAGNVLLQYQNFEIGSNEGRMHVWIHPSFRGKGLATKTMQAVLKYGFSKRKFKKIFAQCKASNLAVCKVMKNCGFRKVKTYTNESGIKKILWVKVK